jgi:hypothetical protein
VRKACELERREMRGDPAERRYRCRSASLPRAGADIEHAVLLAAGSGTSPCAAGSRPSNPTLSVVPEQLAGIES